MFGGFPIKFKIFVHQNWPTKNFFGAVTPFWPSGAVSIFSKPEKKTGKGFPKIRPKGPIIMHERRAVPLPENGDGLFGK